MATGACPLRSLTQALETSPAVRPARNMIACTIVTTRSRGEATIRRGTVGTRVPMETLRPHRRSRTPLSAIIPFRRTRLSGPATRPLRPCRPRLSSRLPLRYICRFHTRSTFPNTPNTPTSPRLRPIGSRACRPFPLIRDHPAGRPQIPTRTDKRPSGLYGPLDPTLISHNPSTSPYITDKTARPTLRSKNKPELARRTIRARRGG